VTLLKPAWLPAFLAACLVPFAARCSSGSNQPATPTADSAGSPQEPGATAGAAPDAPLFTGGANQMEVTLYFMRADGEALAPEKRRIFRTATVNDRARQVLQALFEGSESGLLPAIPPGTTLREFYLGADGTAYVDLSPEFQNGLSDGSEDAVNAIYAVVNTLTRNFEEIQKVKILVGGDEVDDLGGHMSLSHPILPEMGLVNVRPTSGRPARRAPQPDQPSPGVQLPPDPNAAVDPNAPLKPAADKPTAYAPPFRP